MNQFNQKESTLPRGMKSANEDSRVARETSFVITVDDDSGNLLIGKEKISKNQLTEKITAALTNKTPDERIVYIKAAESLKFQTMIELFNSIRKADMDRIALVVIKTDSEESIPKPHTFDVKIPAEPDSSQELPRPNPLTLVVEIDTDKNLFLNREPMGKINDTKGLEDKLTSVFKERENNGVFREGTNEVEKTTFIKASRSLSYGDVAKVIDAVRLSGAQPVGIQIDNLAD
jgi:biopolymer transport protein ExbD